MTRKLLLFLASTLIAFQAMAVEPTSNDVVTNPAELAAVDAVEEDDEWSFWWEAGFDLASNYMWRGFDQSYRGGNRNMVDPSFQPALTLGYGKFYVRLWGNASLFSDYKEFDMFLGFQHEGLEITVYDVFCGVGQDFNAPFFDRLRLHWATTFLHPSDFIIDAEGNERRAFSSYFEVAYTQPVKDWFDVEVIAGASPWTGPFFCPTRVGNEYDWDNPAKGFNVTNLSLTLSREFTKGNVSFPVSLGYTYNPLTKYHYALVTTGFYF